MCVCLPSQPHKPRKPTKKPYHQNPYKEATKRPRPPPVPVFAESPFAVPDFAGHSGDFPGFPSFNIADGEKLEINVTFRCFTMLLYLEGVHILTSSIGNLSVRLSGCRNVG